MPSGSKSETSASRLLGEFQKLMRNGGLKPGDRLPPERDLAKRFGTSRSSLRPVMKILENVGVLLQRVGDGTYLNSNAAGILSAPLHFLILLDGISLMELFEARLMLEPELAARAALSASGEDLEAMRKALAAFEDNPAQADIDFHLAICRATRNRICMRMFEAIHAAFAEAMKVTTRLAPEDALNFHRAIYSAIHLRDAEEARNAMTSHLLHAKGVLLRAYLEGEVDENNGARCQLPS